MTDPEILTTVSTVATISTAENIWTLTLKKYEFQGLTRSLAFLNPPVTYQQK